MLDYTYKKTFVKSYTSVGKHKEETKVDLITEHPKKLQQYELGRELVKGALSVVREAQHGRKRVALKIYELSKLKDDRILRSI
jgi:hypothetical protein